MLQGGGTGRIQQAIDVALVGTNGERIWRLHDGSTAKRKRALAERLRVEADSLDEQAQEAQQPVPHGMMQ